MGVEIKSIRIYADNSDWWVWKQSTRIYADKDCVQTKTSSELVKHCFSRQVNCNKYWPYSYKLCHMINDDEDDDEDDDDGDDDDDIKRIGRLASRILNWHQPDFKGALVHTFI